MDPARFVEKLPLSEMQKIRVHRKQLYRRLDKASAYGDPEYLDFMGSEVFRHLQTLDDRESLLVTRKLCATASRLGVPEPAKTEYDKHANRRYWHDVFDGDQEALSSEGVRKLTEDIRAELKWRRESRNHWMGYIGMIAGAIGAAAALATVLHDSAKKEAPAACVISVDSRGMASVMPPARRQ